MMGWAILLIFIGLLLLVAEVFIPSGGFILVLSIVALVAGVTMIFYAESGGTTTGLITVIGLMVLIPAVVGVALHYWPRTPMGKRFFLPEPENDGSVAALPDYLELGQLKGQIGQTLMPLRPSGVTLIQGHRVDTKTEGNFVDAGQWVRVIDVRPGQVIVRPLDQSELKNLPDLT